MNNIWHTGNENIEKSGPIFDEKSVLKDSI
jgi:hypothetical protein